MDAFVQWWFPVLLSGSRWSPRSEMSPGHGPTGRGKSTQLSLASELVLSGKAGEQDKESDFTKAAPPSPRSICQGLLAKAPPPWEASDTEGEGVLGPAMLAPAPNNMVLALCCITMDAQFP